MMLRLASDDDSDYFDTENINPSMDNRDGTRSTLEFSRITRSTEETANSRSQSEMLDWDDELSNWTSSPSENIEEIPFPERNGGRLLRALGAINLNSSEIEQETSFINSEENESVDIHSTVPNRGTEYENSNRGITWDATVPPEISEVDYQNLYRTHEENLRQRELDMERIRTPWNEFL